MRTGHELDVFFYPEAVALVGASGRPGSFSHEMLVNLSRSFRGRVYAVNPKYREIEGVPSYPSILDIPDEVDLAVIALRAQLVPGAVREAGEKGVKGVVIVAGGFAETGEEGRRLQEEVVRVARSYGIRIVGPNCIGVYNAVNGLDTFFLPREKMRRPPKGYIAVVSQSGAFLTTMMDWLAQEHVGIVKAVNIGNKADVDEAEVIEYYTHVDSVNTVMVYVEGVSPGRGRDLVEAVEKARGEGKNVVFLKGGKTSQGARAARSHTAALAGDYDVFRSVLEEAGAVIAETPQDFIDSAKALSLMRAPAGRRVAVVTNAGGPGVLATDELAKRGLEVPELPRELQERLRPHFPPIVALGNPVDLTGEARDEDYEVVLDELASYEGVDALLVLALVQPATMTIRVADIIADTAWRAKKATVAVTIGAEYGELVKEYLESRGIPTYYMVDRAAAAVQALYQASRKPCTRPEPVEPPRRALEIVEAALAEGRTKLLEHEALELVSLYGVPVPRYCLARSPEEARKCSSDLRAPLVAKIASPDIVHKSDVGGVILGITGPGEAVDAYHRIIENVRSRKPGARISGVVFQEMAPEGVEVIVGSRRDPSFGPIALLGLGGTLVELIRDYTIGLAPAGECTAARMIDGLKASRIFYGYRGKPPLDREAVAGAVEAVSMITSSIPQVAEVEVNPLMVYERGAVAVDARVLLTPHKLPRE